MYFELRGKTYGVKFFRQGTTTVAEWVEVENENKFHTGMMGLAYLHHTDRFEKKVGRVVALTNLLKYLSDHDADYGKVLHREDRKIIWEAYFKTHKK